MLVEKVATPWTLDGLASAYRQAWRTVLGGEPSGAAVALLAAQSTIECGHGGRYAHCNNPSNLMLGGINAPHFISRAPECFPANAIPGGWTVVSSQVACAPGHVAAVPTTGSKFRAYSSLTEGCIDKLRRLVAQWPDAVVALQAAVSADDAHAFVAGLYPPGDLNDYATAGAVGYAASIHSIARSFLEQWKPKMMIEAHLPTVSAGRRNADARAYRLNDPPHPEYDGTPESVLRCVVWLGVERHERWQKTATSTFCNILAHDLCGLMGAYIPRVWWNGQALAELAAGRTPTAVYQRTVREMSANDLCRWLVKHGPAFGWRYAATLDEAQTEANAGKAVIVCARRNVESQSGHISVVIPESDRCRAKRDAYGRVVLPVQCQAGSTNIEMGYLPTAWWRGTEMVEHIVMVHGAIEDDPDTLPDSPSGKSSQKLAAVNAPIVEVPNALDFVRTLADPEEPST